VARTTLNGEGTTVVIPAPRPDRSKRSVFGAGPPARRLSRRWRWRRSFFLLPLAVYIPLVFAYPIAYNFYVSFHHYTLSSLISGTAPYVGLKNFSLIWHDPTFGIALRNTFIFTGVSLIAQYVIGLGLALFFTQKFPLSRLFRSLLILPWLVPGIVGTSAWKWMLNDTNGFVNQLLKAFGLGPVNWLTSPTPALISVIIVNVWIGIAFNFILLYGGLQAIPGDRYEAAAIDGARAWKRFWHVTLPGLRPVTGVLITLGFIYTLKQFDIIWILTRGGPGNASQLLSTWSYYESFVNDDFGRGAAVSDVLFLISLVIVVVYSVRLRRQGTR
jgi:multiple sugar transport system permease protein